METKLIKLEDGYELFTQGFLKGSTNHELIDSLNVEEGNIRYKLSIKNCQAIENGYDLDELAKEKYPYEKTEMFSCFELDCKQEGFIEGAKTILEILSDKKFSEEDMRNAYLEGANQALDFNSDSVIDENKYIQSLQQTEWDVEIVTFTEDDLKSVSEDWGKLGKPKLDTDGCLILKTFKSE